MSVEEHGPARTLGTPAATAPSRYELRGELGGGGMALVFEVFDPALQRSVALKRLRPMREEAHARRAAELLAREYFTLAQLAHPGIVTVHDFGIDALGPFYTMELLDGGDLDAFAPCEPLRACAIAREVCSALAFLHARRLLHRDVSAANVRCTTRSQGSAKLIDFGTVAHMGPSKLLIGTPVYCPPEALYMQPLDARADLFALGATLYFVLTGQHAYPAADFPSLPAIWQKRPVRPSQLVANVPAALDDLVCELIQPERDLRPHSAADVMERLSAISGRASTSERGEVAQAYLSMPPFVGRELELMRVKRQAARAGNGRGSSLLVRGSAGVGITRFLDASILAAKLSGFLVLRADAGDAVSGDCGIVRRLLTQLVHLMPELFAQLTAAERRLLAPLLPAPADGLSLPPGRVLPEAIELAQRLIMAAAARNPLLIAIDDLDAADEPALSLLIALAQAASAARLLILAGAVSDALLRAPLPFGMFARAATELSLARFSADETQQLLAAMFGIQGTPANASLLAERLHTLATGSPRNLMRLAQHLADAGLARYRLGAWSLPADVAHAELPAGVTELLAARISAQSASARMLACGLALCPELSFSFDECRMLSGHDNRAEALRDLDLLMRAEVVREDEAQYTLADRAFGPVLLGELTRETLTLLYRRQAAVFAARRYGGFRSARALWHAGDKLQAIEIFLEENRRVRPDVDQVDWLSGLARSLPDDWAVVCKAVSEESRGLGRTRLEEYTLRFGWALLSAIVGNGSGVDPQLGVLVSMAAGATQLSEWAQLPAAMPAAERFGQSLTAAQARFAATPEHERLMEPVAAISALKDCVRFALAVAGAAYDVETVRALPSFEPFYVVAPALGLIDDLQRGVCARITGRWDEARTAYRLLLRTLDQRPSGMDEAAVEYTRLFVLSALIAFEASLGVRCSEQQLEQLDRHPIFSINARLLRGLLQLWAGDVVQAEETIQAAELLRLRGGVQQVFDRVSLIWQLHAFVAIEDVARTKQTLSQLTADAERRPGWRPFVVYGQAELARLQGQAGEALALLREERKRVKPGQHHAWVLLAAAELRALDALGKHASAARNGLLQLEAAEALGPSACQPLLIALSVVAARAGDARASEYADRALANVERLRATGVNKALAHEARAWVARLQGDSVCYEQQLQQLAAAVDTGPGAAFATKLRRLQQN